MAKNSKQRKANVYVIPLRITSYGDIARLLCYSLYNIALKEARETFYWLKLLVAVEVFPKNKLNDLLNECNEPVAILTILLSIEKFCNFQSERTMSHP